MRNTTFLVLLSAAIMLATSTVNAKDNKQPMSCKLQSDKVKYGERTCVYVCKDKSLEGRTRQADLSCPAYIKSKG